LKNPSGCFILPFAPSQIGLGIMFAKQRANILFYVSLTIRGENMPDKVKYY